MDSFPKTGRRGILRALAQTAAAFLWPARRAQALSGSRPDADAASADRARMDAVARVVLPSGLAEDDRHRIVLRFDTWLEGFAPGRELMATEDTAFLMELPFSRAMRAAAESPRARYRAQLAALDDEAAERHGKAFAGLDAAEAEAIVRELVEGAVERLSLHDLNPIGAPALWLAGPAAFVGTPADHVAIALMAFYFNSAEGVGRSLGRDVDPRTCRGFDGIERPPPERDG